MLKIKLVRIGRKKLPSYRIVVAQIKSKLSGKVVDTLGFYDPKSPGSKITVNQTLLKKWIDLGSRPTESVRKLLKL